MSDSLENALKPLSFPILFLLSLPLLVGVSLVLLQFWGAPSLSVSKTYAQAKSIQLSSTH